MGRGRGRGNKRGRTQRRDFKVGRENVWKKTRVEGDEGADGTGGGWEPFVLESSAFELYYKTLGVVPEGEWEEFMATLRKPLPTTFRINGSGQFAGDIRRQLQEDFYERLKDGVKNEEDGEVVQPIKPLAWYPDNYAWQLGYSRTQLRRVAILEKIHEFLKQENEIGSITRQEAVSMVPPLLLDVQPHHRVLDMCAAPGSKTFQLLEMIHACVEPGEVPQGMVIANDSDVQRCHLLVHQTKRMCSPNIIVTNHEAQRFPGLRNGAGDDGLVFDRILCDVPCSGDGTVRKAPDIWKKWNTGVANGLHRLQIQIAMRGVALLRVGGIMVYSTCSLNPVEDEAVVGAILRESGGSMELLDVSAQLPDLIRRPGMKSWKVRDRGHWLSTVSQVNMHRAGSILPSMFPSGQAFQRGSDNGNSFVGNQFSSTTSSSVESSAVAVGAEETKPDENGAEKSGVELETEVSDLPLERCMRILPHDQDTGGFFIAVLRKNAPWKLPQNVAGQKQPRKLDSLPKVSNGSAAERKDGGTVAPDHQAEAELEGVRGDEQQRDVQEDFLAKEEEPKDVGSISKSDTPMNPAESGAVIVCEGSDAHADEPMADGEVEAMEGPNPAEKPAGRLQQQGRWRGVDPVLFLEDENVIKSLVDYYGVRDSFPLKGYLITRSDDIARLKRIYFVSESVRGTIQLNLSAGQQMKITSAGLKIFERQQSSAAGASTCAFRIVSEGLLTLLPHMTKQIVHCRSRKDFKTLLSSKGVPFHGFQDSIFAAALQNLLIGCCVVALLHTDDEGEDMADMEKHRPFAAAVGCWRGRHTVSLLVSKAEAGQMKQRLALAGEENPQQNENAAAEKALEEILDDEDDEELEENEEENEKEDKEENVKEDEEENETEDDEFERKRN